MVLHQDYNRNLGILMSMRRRFCQHWKWHLAVHVKWGWQPIVGKGLRLFDSLRHTRPKSPRIVTLPTLCLICSFACLLADSPAKHCLSHLMGLGKEGNLCTVVFWFVGWAVDLIV